MNNEEVQSYYQDRLQGLLKKYDKSEKHVRELLAPHLDQNQELTAQVLKEVRQEYAQLIPGLPFIGGKTNRLTGNLEESALFLALFRVLKRHGKTADQTGQVLLDLTKAWYLAYPRWLLHIIGWWEFTGLYALILKRQARKSQRHLYPNDFVYHYLAGDGKDFDFGVDYTECAIQKFLHAQGADEFTPYLCRVDYPISEALGLGLVRTGTLAEGADRCDVRVKRGRPTCWPVSPPGAGNKQPTVIK